jgi:hypothetical protein
LILFPAPERKAPHATRLWGQSVPNTAVFSSEFQALRIEIPFLPDSLLFQIHVLKNSMLKMVLDNQVNDPPGDGMLPEPGRRTT